ncbi:XdhC family protein [Corynebacterium halotolerans]|uniref:XdhC family protein n=1 Tax=Corynebacterium halotolerans TaxID=225326 RepID=UPI003CEC766B
MTQQDDLWPAMSAVLSEDRGFVLATVVATSASAPRPAGTQMAVLDDGRVIGSLSGGCIEADVLARAEEVAATGEPVNQDYGYSDATAFAVGLTCGGSIRVHLERVAPQDLGFFRDLAELVRKGSPVACVTALDGPQLGERHLVVADDSPGAPVETAARELLRQGRSGMVGGYFVRSFAGPDHLVIFGSNAFAAALCRLAKTVGYRVTVCDARATFATRERFPAADEIVVRPPDRYLTELTVDHRTVLCAMTHDPKFDDPLLADALRLPAQFIGAMGSRRTSEERRERLRERGVSEPELGRLRAPLGLDLGAGSPVETAVSVLAEIISARQGGSNLPLTMTRGPIHAR